jgi:1,4-alpha-glucan branching enzyme
MLPSLLVLKASLYPGLCEPINQGGLGFDYYVNLKPSQMWPWLIDNVPLEDWSMTEITETLMNIEDPGKALVYAENHNQSVVGGKSLAEALLGSITNDTKAVSTRTLWTLQGISLHKARFLQLLSCTCLLVLNM